MHSGRLTQAILALGLLVGFSAPAFGVVHIVDCLNGPFNDVATAINAAADGDTVAIKPCPAGPYAPFEIAGKTDVHIVGTLPPPMGSDRALPLEVIVDGDSDFRCIVISNSQGVTLSGLHIRNCGFHAIEVASSVDVSVIGNRIDGGVETIRDQGSLRTRYIGNTIVGGLFSLFIDGSQALISRNRISGDLAIAVLTLNDGNQIIDNIIRDSASEGIIDQGSGSRIERNVVIGNGGLANIVLNSGSSDADVIANVTANSILDQGLNTELFGNR